MSTKAERESESQGSRRLYRELRAHNALVLALVAHRAQEGGWPDCFVCHTLWRGWLELKADKTLVSLKQRYIIKELNARRSGSAFVIRLPDRIEDTKGELILRFTDARDLLLKLHHVQSILCSNWKHKTAMANCRVERVMEERVEIRLEDGSLSTWMFDTFSNVWEAIERTER